MLLALLFLLLTASAFGDKSFDRVAPQPPTPQREASHDVIVKQVKVLAVTSPDIALSRRELKNARGILLRGLSITPKQQIELKTKLLPESIGRPLTQARITLLKESITDFFDTIGRPLVIVHVPEQDVTDRTLVLVVTESKLDTITIKGNKHFKTRRYRNAIRLKKGDYISSDRLSSDIAWINRNHFRTANAILKPGPHPGTTDIDIFVKDSRPFRIYAGTDNTGFSETGLERNFIGFNWGNMFGTDQILSYQFTASSDFHKFLAHTGHYTVPLPWRNLLVFFGGYSSVDAPSLEDRAFASSGNSAQASGRYVVPFGITHSFSQEVKLGVDWKRTNNTLTQGGNTVSRQNVNIFQFSLGYHLSKELGWVSNDFDVELFASPGALLPKMSNKRFGELRAGATNQYAYIRGRLEQTYHLPHTATVILRIEGQLASKKLLPSEEFGLGGFYSVRGYRERVVNADDALFLSIQPQTPVLHLRRHKDDALIFFVFTDVGIGGNQLSDKGVTGTSSLIGVGPGVKYSVKNHVSLHGDWGYQVSKSPKDDKRNRFNFRVVLSY